MQRGKKSQLKQKSLIKKMKTKKISNDDIAEMLTTQFLMRKEKGGSEYN